MTGHTSADGVRYFPEKLDLVFTVVLTGLVLANLVSESFTTPVERDLDIGGYLLAGFTALTVAWCRSAPAAAFGVFAAATLLYVYLGYPVHPGQSALFVVLYFFARRCPNSVFVSVAVVATLVGSAVSFRHRIDETTMQRLGVSVVFLLPIVATLVGRTLRSNEATRIELRRRLTATEAARNAHAARLLAEQRLAIARDLHDTVAHSVATVSVQSGAALAILDHDPEAARKALQNIRLACDAVISDTQSTLAGLRDPSDPRAPTLKETAEQGRESGLDVQLVESAEALPGVVAGALRRIAQESVSNVLRHSSATGVRIELQTNPESAILRVEDNGVPSEANPTSGNGIRGMRERASLLGGRLEAGPATDGGFVVAAEIPFS